MRIKLTLNRGIATLALSASMFLGCQDFLSEDKAVQAAKTSTGENVRPAILEASPQDKAGTESATDLPLKTADTSKPAAPTAPSTPSATDSVAECKKIQAEMQTAQEPLYGELKDRFSTLQCFFVLSNASPSVPPTPPDSATLCKNLRSTLAMLDPSSPKYPSYQHDIATYCAGAKTPAAPVAPPSTPAAQGNEAECKEIYAAMQNAKEPLYGELKNKFGSLNCDLFKALGPYVPPTPPDSATVCKNLKSTLAMLDPSSPKYPGYLADIATYCTP